MCSDYRGLQDITKMKGSPTSFACWKCWIPGFSIGPGKTLFSNHFQLLPLSHRFRRKKLNLIGLNNPPPKPVRGGPRNPSPVRRTGRETPARKRTAIEVRKNRLRPYRNPKLLPGEAQCTYDGEHGVKHLHQHLCLAGQFMDLIRLGCCMFMCLC